MCILWVSNTRSYESNVETGTGRLCQYQSEIAGACSALMCHHLNRGGNSRGAGLCVLKWREVIYAIEKPAPDLGRTIPRSEWYASDPRRDSPGSEYLHSIMSSIKQIVNFQLKVLRMAGFVEYVQQVAKLFTDFRNSGEQGQSQLPVKRPTRRIVTVIPLTKVDLKP